MKIEITSYGKKVSVETERDDHTIGEVIEMIAGLIHQIGYGEKMTATSMIEFAEEKLEN